MHTSWFKTLLKSVFLLLLLSPVGAWFDLHHAGMTEALAQEPNNELVRVVFATPHEVEYIHKGSIIRLATGDRMPFGGEIITHAGRAALALKDGSIVRVTPNSRLQINQPSSDVSQPASTFLTTLGRVLFDTRNMPKGADKKHSIRVGKTVASSENAVFVAELDEQENALFGVHDGRVKVSGRAGNAVQARRGDGVLALKTVDTLKKVKLPATPTPQHPFEKVSQEFTVQWAAVEGIEKYRIRIGKDKNLNDIAFSANLVGNVSLSFELFVPGTYYWVVEAVDSLGFASIPSSPVQIHVRPGE